MLIFEGVYHIFQMGGLKPPTRPRSSPPESLVQDIKVLQVSPVHSVRLGR